MIIITTIIVMLVIKIIITTITIIIIIIINIKIITIKKIKNLFIGTWGAHDPSFIVVSIPDMSSMGQVTKQHVSYVIHTADICE